MRGRQFFSVEKSRKHFAIILSFLLLSQSFLIHGLAQRTLKKQNANNVSGKFSNTKRVVHVLNRLSFGARPYDVERVQKIGVEAYIEEQLNPDTLDDSTAQKKIAPLSTLALSTPTLLELYRPKPVPVASPTPMPASINVMPVTQPEQSMSATEVNKTPSQQTSEEMKKPEANNMGMQKPTPQESPKPSPSPTPQRNSQQGIIDLQRATLLRAVYSERQLYEMTVAFWNNHFSIFSQKDADRYLLPAFDRDVIRPFAFSRFRDLLGATAHSPAMLFYLDNHNSSVLREYPAKDGKPARRTGGVNENYARELMELHTLGVDGGYTQKDVEEVARCFTGWSIRKPNEEGLFFFNPSAHDNGEKIVLGQKIPANGGIKDGEMVLDILARHPSTAKFIATKLARRFISDEPPATVINRASAVFLKTDGDIRATLRAIITSPEFFAAASYRAKIKSPFEYAAAVIRATGADTNADTQVINLIARMGQPMFGKITPDGYRDYAEQWLSTGQMVERLNFASALAANKIKGTKLDAAKLLEGTDVNDLSAVSKRLSGLFLNNDLSSQTQTALDKTLTKLSASNINNTQSAAPQTEKQIQVSVAFNRADIPKERADKIAELIILVLGSPEFQRR